MSDPKPDFMLTLCGGMGSSLATHVLIVARKAGGRDVTIAAPARCGSGLDHRASLGSRRQFFQCITPRTEANAGLDASGAQLADLDALKPESMLSADPVHAAFSCCDWWCCVRQILI